jgi:hypothetical protein
VHQLNIHIYQETVVASAKEQGDGTYDVLLNDDSQLKVHRIILATEYRPNMRNVAFLDCATILDPLATVDGFPALAPEFQTNLPNLYITGLAATLIFKSGTVRRTGNRTFETARFRGCRPARWG